MIKILKRITDNKYLQSLENDVWVDDINHSSKMTYKECETIKESLLNSYDQEQIVEITDCFKFKPITRAEKKELKNLLKKL